MLHCMSPIYESVPLSYSIYIYSLSLYIYYLYMLDMLYGGFRHGLVRFLPFVLDSPLSVTSPKGFAKETSRLRVKLITVGAMSYLSGWLFKAALASARRCFWISRSTFSSFVRPWMR